MRQLLSSCMTDYSRWSCFGIYACTRTHTHTHACGGRKDATGRATISEVNLGSDRGNAGAGAFRNRRRNGTGKGDKRERGEGCKRKQRPGPARASDAPMPPISSS